MSDLARAEEAALAIEFSNTPPIASAEEAVT
jgi:hypothetical protein